MTRMNQKYCFFMNCSSLLFGRKRANSSLQYKKNGRLYIGQKTKVGGDIFLLLTYTLIPVIKKMVASIGGKGAMFDFFGRFACRFRYAILTGWFLLVVGITLLAPNLSDVAVSDQSGYLPASSPSIVAAGQAAHYFPNQAAPVQAVVVLTSGSGSMRDPENISYLSDLTNWLQNEAAPGLIGQVLSPVDPALVGRLISPDGQVAMIFAPLQGASEEPRVVQALQSIQNRLAWAPNGITGYVTGGAAIAHAYKESALQSAARTTVITIILVISVLLIIYRSPVSSLVPLLTIGVAYGVTRGLVAWLSRLGWTVSSVTDVFLIVLLFGAGTDYCLFLVSRFREAMGEGMSGPFAASHTVARVGETITSSAATVIVGMVGMFFARMKLFSNTGPSLALGIAVALLAGLTLTPALLAIMGRWAFWPGRLTPLREGGLWVRWSARIAARPWIPLLLVLILLVPLALYGRGQQRTFDLLADLPGNDPAKAGFSLLSRSFGAGQMQPIDIIVTGPPSARSPQGVARVQEMSSKLAAVQGVGDVRSLVLPSGSARPDQGNIIRVDGQLALLADAISSPGAAVGGISSSDPAAAMAVLRNYLDELAATYPDVQNQPSYQTARSSVDLLEAGLGANRSRLLVSAQLAEANGALATARQQAQPATSFDLQQLDQVNTQLVALHSYLSGLAGAYPQIVAMDGYNDALVALSKIEGEIGRISVMLLVSSQLDAIASNLAGTASSLQSPEGLSQLGSTSQQTDTLAALGSYLQELAGRYPELAAQPSFISATNHLRAVQAALPELERSRLLNVQLATISGQFSTTLQALQSNPLVLAPQPGQPTAEEQMDALSNYLNEVGTAFPTLTASPDFGKAQAGIEQMRSTTAQRDLNGIRAALQTLRDAFGGLAATAQAQMPDATFTPSQGPGKTIVSVPGLERVTQNLDAAAQDFAALAQVAREQMPDSQFVPTTRLPGADPGIDPTATINASLGDLSDALQRLQAAVAAQLPDATYIPSRGLDAGQVPPEVRALATDATALQDALRTLANGFHQPDAYMVPTSLAAANPELGRLLDAYLTPSGEASRVQVLLSDEPFSSAAQETVFRIREAVESNGVFVSGSTAILLDLKETMDADFIRVLILVLAGIAVVLALLLRSLLAPLYLLATILLSYGATLGLTRLVFEAILHQGLTWWVPFFMFVLLVALGMDYNIFLMGRVKEESALHGTRLGVARALARTGGVITSAGLVMAGTFAAMMSSSLLGLVQLAFAVTVGVLLDTFVVRTLLVPAIVVLLDRWNWWPRRRPVG